MNLKKFILYLCDNIISDIPIYFVIYKTPLAVFVVIITVGNVLLSDIMVMFITVVVLIILAAIATL